MWQKALKNKLNDDTKTVTIPNYEVLVNLGPLSDFLVC